MNKPVNPRILRAIEPPAPIPETWREMTAEQRTNTLTASLAEGERLHTTALRLSTTHATLSRWAAAVGLTKPPIKRGGRGNGSAWAALTPEERDVVAARDESIDTIARDMQVAKTTISGWAKARNIKPERFNRTRPKRKTLEQNPEAINAPWHNLTPAERTQTIQELFAEGKSGAYIQKKLGCCASTFSVWCRRNNIARPAPPPPPNATAPWHHETDARKLEMLREATARFSTARDVSAYLGVGQAALRKFAAPHGLRIGAGHSGNGRRNGSHSGPRAPKPRSLSTGNVRPRVAERNYQQPRAPAERPTPYTMEKPDRVHITEARPDMCRFPLWPDAGYVSVRDMFYCGDPRMDPTTSYCAHCRSVSVQRSISYKDMVRWTGAR